MSATPDTTVTTAATATAATTLLDLHRAPQILSVVNVWDSISSRVVTDLDGTVALATASHSIAASRGYEDGEEISVEEMIEEVRRIVVATRVPVSADLEGGYGDAPATIRRAIEVGVAGANIEDQLKPLAEATAQVEAIMSAAADAGVPDFVLNARTDAFVLGADNPLEEAVKRGRAYLEAGAPVVFVPGPLDEDQIKTLVDAFGEQRLSVIGLPGVPAQPRLQELGVARISYGPLSQRVALTALAELVESVRAGGVVSENTRPLN